MDKSRLRKRVAQIYLNCGLDYGIYVYQTNSSACNRGSRRKKAEGFLSRFVIHLLGDTWLRSTIKIILMVVILWIVLAGVLAMIEQWFVL